MDTSVDGSVVIVFITKILPERSFLIARNMQRVFHEFVDTLILCGGDRYYRHPKSSLHPVNINAAAVCSDLIHHIERDDHRSVHLQKLHRKIQISLDICSVNDVDDRFRLFRHHKVPGYYLLAAVRGHGIDTGKIRYQSVRMSLDNAVLAVDRDTGKVSHMLVGTGKLIEKSCLAAVLVTHEGKSKHSACRQRITASFWMEFSALTKTGVNGNIDRVFLRL